MENKDIRWKQRFEKYYPLLKDFSDEFRNKD